MTAKLYVRFVQVKWAIFMKEIITLKWIYISSITSEEKYYVKIFYLASTVGNRIKETIILKWMNLASKICEENIMLKSI